MMFRLCLVGFLFPVVLFVGCATTTTQHGTNTDYRNWNNLEYAETVRVETEPPGCRVYCQDSFVGIAPLETTIRAPLTVSQTGTYPTVYKATKHYDPLFWDPINPTSFTRITNKDQQRAGETVWGRNFTVSVAKPVFVFKAFRNDGASAQKVLNLNEENDPILRAVANASISSDGRIASTISGYRSILLVVSAPPLVTERSNNSDGKPLPNNQSDAQARELAEARQEYNQALAAYDDAVANLKAAKVRRGIGDAIPGPRPTTGIMGVVNFVNTVSAPVEMTALEEAVRQTKERLDRAQARLTAAESK